ncbi:MAG: SIMPL domain-containing protein [Gammaproteobacteria bacterium]|nr:SIMPL domain-containing protein [Gammaproteobacteria bacterium]
MHLLACLFTLVLAAPAMAGGEPLSYDRVSLSASAEREIANDIQVVVLRAQAEGDDTAALAREVNRRVRRAVDRAKAVPGVEVQTLDYQTRPVYRQQNLVAWRVSHAVRLESRDSTSLSGLLAELQEGLNLVSLDYTVSPEARQQAEKSLMAEALALFRQRADDIVDQLERPGYRIVHIDINTSSDGGRPPMMRAMAMESANADSAPVLEAGKQRLQVDVRGTIELRVE